MMKIFSRLLLFIAAILFLGCKNQKNNALDDSLKIKIDSIENICSPTIINQFKNMFEDDDKLPLSKRIYSVYIKNYLNGTTLYVTRQSHVDSTQVKFANKISFIYDNLIFFYD